MILWTTPAPYHKERRQKHTPSWSCLIAPSSSSLNWKPPSFLMTRHRLINNQENFGVLSLARKVASSRRSYPQSNSWTVSQICSKDFWGLGGKKNTPGTDPTPSSHNCSLVQLPPSRSSSYFDWNDLGPSLRVRYLSLESRIDHSNPGFQMRERKVRGYLHKQLLCVRYHTYVGYDRYDPWEERAPHR